VEQQDTFRGSPWNARPTEDWNRSPYWTDYYRELLAEADPWRRGLVVHRDIDLLIRMLSEAGEIPRRSSPQTFLDAGCGVALIPHVLAFWGFQVTAIDSCPRAIEVALQHRPSEEELSRCVPVWDPCKDMPGAHVLADDPARSLQRLRSFKAPGGSVSYIADDWFTADLRPQSFGVVHCRNSLRCSTKPYWRRSLHRFHELLSPGGVFLLENVNAIGIQDEVEELLAECEFVPLMVGASREPVAKHVISTWPTG
jgi:SAM-dependent methyltransferase